MRQVEMAPNLLSLVAPQQRIVYAGCAAEVAVDLERWMRIEHVPVGRTTFSAIIGGLALRQAKLFRKDLRSMVSITEPGIRADRFS